MKPFEGFDFSDFWSEIPCDQKLYTCEKLDKALCEKASSMLQCRIPESYLQVLYIRNGGIPVDCCYEFEHDGIKKVEITAFLGIGTCEHSLCGTYGSRYAIEQMGYPDIGLYFTETSSEGLFVLPYIHADYEEPIVCYVDQQNDFAIYPIENSLEAFFQKLIKIEKDNETILNDPISDDILL